MSAFTSAEITYLESQRLGRLATIGPGGQAHVVPVGFRYSADEDTIDMALLNERSTAMSSTIREWRS